MWERQWPDGQCTGLRVERSGFKTWPGYYVVFFGKTLLLFPCLAPPRKEFKWVLKNCQGSLMKY